MNHVVSKKTVYRFHNGSFQEIEDEIVSEFPVTILLGDEEFATLVCTPEHIEELVIGFLASEGVISSYDDIENITLTEQDGFAAVSLRRMNKFNKLNHSKRYITSCCGKSRQSFYFYNDAKTVKNLSEQTITLAPDACFSLMQQMQQEAELFQNTGGVHNAALCDQNGILLSRTDIGRHNALDKIYGHCLKHNVSLSGKVMVFSGRISSEVLLKVAKIGCEIVLSKSAPTELALQIAEEVGITTVGFIRNRSLNVYTHPERIAGTK